ncbi:MAG: hypothetical protein O3A84_07045 [Proteobacteria bacterium]|nr:hypothetical protein [Pseudomonadota bacterium]
MASTPRGGSFVTKLKKQGNSTGVTLVADVLREANLSVGDGDVDDAAENKIVISKSNSDYTRAMAAGRKFSAHYSRTMADLAK